MESIKQRELFEDSPVFSAVLRLALPTIAGQIILVIYNMADTFFVSLTGSDAMLCAVTICMPAFMILSALSNLFGIGGAGVISRALGRRQNEQAKDASSFAFWGCLASTLLYSLLVLLFLHPFVDLLGGTDTTVHAHACVYLTYTVVIGGLATAQSALFSHLIRAQGFSLMASIGIAGGGLLNIALDPLFMFVILPPGNEALGAAAATALSNMLSLAYFIVITVHMRRDSVLSFRPQRALASRQVDRELLATGLPACLMTLFENISYAVLDKLLSLAGVAVQAGIGVAKKVNMLAHCIARGMSQGVLPLIGYNYAAGNYRRMRSAVLLSSSLAAGLALLCALGNIFFARQMTGIFLVPGASQDYGSAFLRILSIGCPFSAYAYSFISFFQAVGRGGRSFFLATLRKGLLDISLMFLLRLCWPVFGSVWATPITDIVCCAVAAILFFAFLKRERAAGQGELACEEGRLFHAAGP